MGFSSARRERKIDDEQRRIDTSIALAMSTLTKNLQDAELFGVFAFQSLLKADGDVDEQDYAFIRGRTAVVRAQVQAILSKIDALQNIAIITPATYEADGVTEITPEAMDVAATTVALNAYIADNGMDIPSYTSRF